MLIPLAWLYGLGVWIRNKLFDWGVLPSESFPVPVISVGNLSAGGAGKTPHVEYLVETLKNRYSIAVLSRGYKRKTQGFILADENATASTIGDEPLQIHQKFPTIKVAVHEKRRKGIKELLQRFPEINLIILDDAFQHRYVNPGLNLLLTGYYNPFFRNFLLPAGNLREARHRAGRAHAVIVTKTPAVFSPLDRSYYMRKLQPYNPKKVFFSKMTYQQWVPLFHSTPYPPPKKVKSVFLITGIAHPESLEVHLEKLSEELIVHSYPDHHHFSLGNLKKLRKQFEGHISHSKIIITTEKDAMRLRSSNAESLLKDLPVYYIPIKVEFQDRDKAHFDELLNTFLRQFENPTKPSSSWAETADK